MKYLSLTFKNLWKFIKEHPLLFCLLLIVQIVSCVEVFISCGMAYNMNYTEKKERIQPNFVFAFSFPYDSMQLGRGDDGTLKVSYFKNKKELEYLDFTGSLPFGEYKEAIEELTNRTKKYHISCLDLVLNTDKIIKVSDNYFMAMDFDTMYPDYYTPHIGLNEIHDLSEYANSSDPVFFSPVNLSSNAVHLGDTVNFYGKKYKCIGEYVRNYIPFNAVPDQFVITMIDITFSNSLTQTDIDDILHTMQSLFPIDPENCTVPEAADPDALQLSTMLFVVSALVMLIVLLAIAKFYSFILSERKTNLMVMRLCGCTRGKAHLIYMLEIILMLIVSTGTGMAVFRYGLFDFIASMYPSFEEFYLPQTYFAVAGCYLAAAVVIMALSVIPAVRISVIDMKRNR